jgi:hypothetical protein
MHEHEYQSRSKDHHANEALDFGYQVGGPGLRLRRWPHSVISQATRAAHLTASTIEVRRTRKVPPTARQPVPGWGCPGAPVPPWPRLCAIQVWAVLARARRTRRQPENGAHRAAHGHSGQRLGRAESVSVETRRIRPTDVGQSAPINARPARQPHWPSQHHYHRHYITTH